VCGFVKHGIFMFQTCLQLCSENKSSFNRNMNPQQQITMGEPIMFLIFGEMLKYFILIDHK